MKNPVVTIALLSIIFSVNCSSSSVLLNTNAKDEQANGSNSDFLALQAKYRKFSEVVKAVTKSSKKEMYELKEVVDCLGWYDKLENELITLSVAEAQFIALKWFCIDSLKEWTFNISANAKWTQIEYDLLEYTTRIMKVSKVEMVLDLYWNDQWSYLREYFHQWNWHFVTHLRVLNPRSDSVIEKFMEKLNSSSRLEFIEVNFSGKNFYFTWLTKFMKVNSSIKYLEIRGSSEGATIEYSTLDNLMKAASVNFSWTTFFLDEDWKSANIREKVRIIQTRIKGNYLVTNPKENSKTFEKFCHFVKSFQELQQNEWTEYRKYENDEYIEWFPAAEPFAVYAMGHAAEVEDEQNEMEPRFADARDNIIRHFPSIPAEGLKLKPFRLSRSDALMCGAKWFCFDNTNEIQIDVAINAKWSKIEYDLLEYVIKMNNPTKVEMILDLSNSVERRFLNNIFYQHSWKFLTHLHIWNPKSEPEIEKFMKNLNSSEKLEFLEVKFDDVGLNWLTQFMKSNNSVKKLIMAPQHGSATIFFSTMERLIEAAKVNCVWRTFVLDGWESAKEIQNYNSELQTILKGNSLLCEI